MLTQRIAVAGIALLALSQAAPAAEKPTPPGDRGIPMNIVYPPAAFVEGGGCVRDLAKPPFNAKGDGVTDNTRAFVAMMNFMRDAIKAKRKESGVFYLPNGTYLVRDTITYEGPDMDYDFCNINLVGQDRARTVIRLADSSPGFGAGADKAVLTWFRDWGGWDKTGGRDARGSNIAWNNEIRNITVNTGRGNPGAIGVVFLGANAASLDNLAVVSEDGQGSVGLAFPVWSVQGYFNDITVKGFDYGIRATHGAESNPVLEYVTLSGQRKAGVRVDRACPSIRRLRSDNAVPAVTVQGRSAHLVLVDSVLAGGRADQAAVVCDEPSAQVFLRNVETSGYGKAVDCALDPNPSARRLARVAPPPGTKAAASFATDGGPEKLIDDDSESFMGGAEGSCNSATEPVWVDLVFPAPVPDLAAVETGAGEKYENYFAKKVEIWVDTDGNGTFDTLAGWTAELGPAGNQAQVIEFTGRVPRTHGLRLLVTEQNLAGARRCFAMNELKLLADPAAAPLKATPEKDAARRAGNPASARSAAPKPASAGPTRSAVPAGRVVEWLNGPVFCPAGKAPRRTMNLPVEEFRPVPWESNPGNWTVVAPNSGPEAIQAALSSGKPAVYFTKGSYCSGLKKWPELDVPASVRQIELMDSDVWADLNITGESSEPLWIAHTGGKMTKINQKVPRTVFIRYGGLGFECLTEKPATAHLLAVVPDDRGHLPRFCPPNLRLYARSIDNEDWGNANFNVDGGLMWVLGYKTEMVQTCFLVKNGGFLEVLGGYRNQTGNDKGLPMVHNRDSNVSFVGFSSMSHHYRQAIWEERDGRTFKLTMEDMPPRRMYGGDFYVPLYVGYDPARVAALAR